MIRPRFYTAKILEVRDETSEAYSLIISPPEEAWLDYLPGQYLTFKVWIEGEEYRRAFSLSSAPGVDDFLRVTIKRIPQGRVSNHLYLTLKPGDEVEIMPPMGNFVTRPSGEHSFHYVLIGAGSGITPLLSILRTALEREPDSKVTLWLCNRAESLIIFKEELALLGKAFGQRLHVYHTLTQPSDSWKGFSGRLDKKRIYALVSDLFMVDEHRKQYYLCGPLGLMEEAEAALDQHAVNPADVYRELFSAPAPTEAEAEAYFAENSEQPPAPQPANKAEGLEDTWIKVLLDGSLHYLEVIAGQTILASAKSAKLDPPYACQSGICTTCRAMLVSGEVRMDETEGLSREELEQGYILTCQAHPLNTEVEVEFR